MIEFYPEIRLVHIWAALASGGLLLLRGVALFAGAGWPRAAPLALLGYTLDAVLLTAALMLMTMLGQYPFGHAWLTVKLLLLVLYVTLGSLALRRAGTRRVRFALWLAALAVFAYIVSVARAHDPLGLLAEAG